MKKKLILVLTCAFMSLGTATFVLLSDKNETSFAKAKNEEYNLNITDLSSTNTTLTTSNGNHIEFEVSGYSNGTFSSGAYIKNKTPINGLESLIVTFNTPDKDLTITYGWNYDEYYLTNGSVSSENWTYYFDSQDPSYLKIENKSGYDVSVSNITLTYSCSETVKPEGFDNVIYGVNSDGKTCYAKKKDTSIESAIILPEYNGKPVTTIYDQAFGDCSLLTSVFIPNTITKILRTAFQGCTSLQYNEYDNAIYLGNPSNLYFALIRAKNASISSCDIADSCKLIAASAFSDCSSLDSIDLPSGLNSISAAAFSDCTSLTSINIPNSVTLIGENSFSDCSSLNFVNLGNNVDSIADRAFSGCSSLTLITIPSSVKSIGDSVFMGCSSLSQINVDELNESYTSVDGVLFSKNMKYIITCPSAKNGIYTIPNSVTSIANTAFCGCSLLTSIIIPNSVITIGNSAFYGCSSLISIVLPDKLIGIGRNAFEGCSALVAVTIPDSVTGLGQSAFKDCVSLESVVVSKNVSGIADSMFNNCSSLTSVTFRGNMGRIGGYAFYGCSSLTTITIPNEVTTLDSGAFAGCTSLESIIIPNSLTTIKYYVFSGCTSLSSIVIPINVTSIVDYAFYGCSSLTIYCEAESRPSGWSYYWNASNCPVVWGYSLD